MNLKRQTKRSILILLILMTIIAGWFGFQTIARWFNENEIKFNQIIKVEVKAPFEVVKRKPIIQKIVLEGARPEEVNTPIKEYACKKWGEFNCLIMIAVFQAESGWNNEAWGFNPGPPKSLDYGIAQINSGNWKLEGCSLAEIVDPYKNINCGYKIWDRADGIEGNNKGAFTPWIVYKTGQYLGNLWK